MPIKSKTDGFAEEKSLYAPTVEYAVMILALDHFFAEVVEGNLPLNTAERWWDREIVNERVNRYSRNWCLLYECLSHLRDRLEEQGIYAEQVQIDETLAFTYKSHRRPGPPVPMEWEPQRP